MNPFRVRGAVAALKQIEPADDAVIRPGESLGDAFARRLGIPIATRPELAPDDIHRPTNRAARRAAARAARKEHKPA